MSAVALMLLEEAPAAVVELYEKGLDGRLQTIRNLAPVTSTGDAAQRNDASAEAKRAWKQLEEIRKGAIEPLLREQRQINDYIGGIQARLKECSAHLGRQLNAWEDQERARVAREREEARKKQEQAALAEAQAVDKGDMKAAEEASKAQTAAALSAPLRDAPKGIKSDAGTSYTRPKTDFEIKDPAAVPRELCTPDPVLIRAAIKAGVTEIPGVAIFETTVRTTRTR